MKITKWGIRVWKEKGNGFVTFRSKVEVREQVCPKYDRKPDEIAFIGKEQSFVPVTSGTIGGFRIVWV